MTNGGPGKVLVYLLDTDGQQGIDGCRLCWGQSLGNRRADEAELNQFGDQEYRLMRAKPAVVDKLETDAALADRILVRRERPAVAALTANARISATTMSPSTIYSATEQKPVC